MSTSLRPDHCAILSPRRPPRIVEVRRTVGDRESRRELLVDLDTQARLFLRQHVGDRVLTEFASVHTLILSQGANQRERQTAIHAGDADENRKTEPDPTFVPLITAPCFPSYPSAHGTLSGAAREVLERLYGPRHHDITFSTAS